MYDITQQMRRNLRFFWPRAASRVYAQAKRLSRRGLARTRVEADGKRTRSIYTITSAGRRELARWLAAPPRGTALECEPLLRVMFADFARRGDVIAALRQAREDGVAILEVGKLVGPEYLRREGPFQDQVHVRAFLFDFLSHFGRFLISWSERTEAVYGRWPEWSDEERIRSALAIIGRNLEEYPDELRPGTE
jgi:DNA-binding PadR family transcriptional regulator